MNYRNYQINTPADVRPWGGREQQAWEDIIDNVNLDCITQVSDVTGHKHYRLFSPNANASVVVSNTQVTLAISQADETKLYIQNQNANGASLVELKGNDIITTRFIHDSVNDMVAIEFAFNNFRLRNRGVTQYIKITSDVDQNYFIANSDNDKIFLGANGTHPLMITKDYVGIGNFASGGSPIYIVPDCLLHIHAGSAGVVSAIANTIFCLEKNDTVIMQFLSPNNKYNIINFGDVDDNSRGQIFYDHGAIAADFMGFATAGVTSFYILGDGGIGMSSLKSGATQIAAGAAVSELWKTNGHASLPNGVIMIGI
jgi:hypothetical protein